MPIGVNAGPRSAIWSPGYWENLPFKGEIPFELTLRLWGKTVKRKAKVVFAHAPDGQYYCTGSKTLKESIISTRWHIEVLTVPRDWAVPKGKPRWVNVDGLIEPGVLSDEAWTRFSMRSRSAVKPWTLSGARPPACSPCVLPVIADLTWPGPGLASRPLLTTGVVEQLRRRGKGS
jgi:hypothetical protein